MADFEEVIVTLQTSTEVEIHSWAGNDDALPLIIVAPDTSPRDWDEFVPYLSPSHSPLLARVTSPLELLMLIWEIGEPVLLLAQGPEATAIASETVATAAGSISSLIICDGELSDGQLDSMHEIATLILRGRQNDVLSHESAVRMHDALRHSILIEPENCANFPAKDNPDAAASAVNWFIAGPGNDSPEFDEAEPVDPKA